MLDNFIQGCWADFQQKKCNPQLQIVNPSIPILWFGNMEEYEKSDLRIVTIGLNPSRREFQDKTGTPYSVNLRFNGVDRIGNNIPLQPTDILLYKSALNAYFDHSSKPYMKWFAFNEKVLNCLDASYRTGKSYRAIHIDLYTPIATDPTWGKLDGIVQTNLRSKCKFCFANFLKFLNPNVVVISANYRDVNNNFTHYNVVDLQGFISKSAYHKQVKPNNHNSYIAGYKLKSDTSMIWGSNFRGNPFGAINKYEIIAPLAQIKQTLSIP